MVAHVRPSTQVWQNGSDVDKAKVRTFVGETDSAVDAVVSDVATLDDRVDDNTAAIAAIEEAGHYPPLGPVKAATTANLDLIGGETIDGVVIGAGDYVLVKNQTAPADNGIYVAAVGAWARRSDANSAAELAGILVAVDEGGATNGGNIFLLPLQETDIVLGTTALHFSQVNSTYIGPASITDEMLATPRFCENRAALKTLFGPDVEMPDDFLVMVGGMYTAGDGLGGLFQYQADVSGGHDPDGRAIVTDDEGRDFICVQPDPFGLLPVDPGGNFDAFGDSITSGSGASGASTRWPNRFAAKTGQVLKNRGVGGKGTWYTTTMGFTHLPPQGSTRGASIGWAAGHNDLYTGDAANLKTPGKMASELTAFLGACWAETFIPFADATFTKTGGWGSGDTSLFDKTSIQFSPSRIITGSAGKSITANITGENVIIHAYDGPDLGALEITLGAASVTYDCSVNFSNDPIDAGAAATHAGIFIDGIGGGTNALALDVVAGLGTNTLMYLDGLAVLKAPAQCESVFVLLPPRPTTYSGGGSHLSTEESWNLGDMALIALVNRFRAKGFPVVIVPTNDFLDPAHITADVEHPNDFGHEDIARAVASRCALSGTQGWGSYVPELVSWTTSAGTLVTDGRVSRKGNVVEFWAKITKAGGGTYSTTKGTSFVKVPKPFPMAFPGTFVIANSSTGAEIGTGLINTDGNIWIPTMTTANGQLIIHGSYLVGDTEAWSPAP